MRGGPNAGFKTTGEGHKTKGGKNEKDDGKEDLGNFHCVGLHGHGFDPAGKRFREKAHPAIRPFGINDQHPP